MHMRRALKHKCVYEIYIMINITIKKIYNKITCVMHINIKCIAHIKSPLVRLHLCDWKQKILKKKNEKMKRY